MGKDRYAYATDSLPSGATLRVLPDPAPVANAHLAQKGHAAMGVRALAITAVSCGWTGSA